MCGFTSRGHSLSAGLLACLAGAALTVEAGAQSDATAPDFSSNRAAWIAIGNDFIPPAHGPKPVSFDPALPLRAQQCRAPGDVSDRRPERSEPQAMGLRNG